MSCIRARNYVPNILRRLWTDESSKDMTIVSRLRVKTKCHKSIFSVLSPYVSEVRVRESLFAPSDLLLITF